MILTTFITFLLRDKPTRMEAGKEARRLGVNLTWAEWYWRTLV